MTGNPISGLPLTPVAQDEAVSKAYAVEGVNTDRIIVSPTEPVAPATGDIWIDSDEEASGGAGYVAQPEAPADTDMLWYDTDDNTPTSTEYNVMRALYPVGTIYTNKTNATNPGTLFGFGTWVALAGRVVVGLDPTQTEFDTAGEEGGTKTETLTTAQMPVHTHNFKWRVNFPKGTRSLATNDLGGDALLVSDNMPGGNSTSGYDAAVGKAGNENTGGGGAHNNLQPYVVAYMWERTA